MSSYFEKYRKGGEGFCKWVEDYVNLRIYPKGSEVPIWIPVSELPGDTFDDTGRSYKGLWEMQKEIAIEALRMENGEFVYRMVVFCWPRGEGKSLFVCLIVLWKWFCWPAQQVVLGANSKDQVKFVHFDIIRDIVVNSPKILSVIGPKNVKRNDIVIKDRYGNETAAIKPISAFTGIVSNINMFTFSEMFRMKDPTYYTELSSSIRNVPNAMGLIDSTVSAKSHQLYRLYEAFVENKNPNLYFSYRFSQTGDPADYMHPRMNAKQLESYRVDLVMGGFERFLLNRWDSGADKAFATEQVQAINYWGVNSVMNHKGVTDALRTRNAIKEQQIKILDKNDYSGSLILQDRMDRTVQDLWPVDKIYAIKDGMATRADLAAMGDMIDTHWAILVGVDRADPMSKRYASRTIVTCLAKGLIGSRRNPFQNSTDAPEYFYVVIGLFNISDHSIKGIKDAITMCSTEFEGVDTMGSERYGMVDMKDWCEDQSIKIEIYYPSYTVQRSIFTEVYLSVNKGKFKAPYIDVPGARETDILQEEFKFFDHDDGAKRFGSAEKFNRNGVQDDVVYSIGAAMYGGRGLTVADFRDRTGEIKMAEFYQNRDLMGKW